MKTSIQALGRLKIGVMNKTEAAYEALLRQRLIAGEVAWYRFEGLKLRLADNTLERDPCRDRRRAHGIASPLSAGR